MSAKLVGREPTEEMRAAAYPRVGFRDKWRAAWDAAPDADAGRVFSCAALRSGSAGGNDPAECDWPVCGCDPHADKVIAALQEMGGADAGRVAELERSREGLLQQNVNMRTAMDRLKAQLADCQCGKFPVHLTAERFQKAIEAEEALAAARQRVAELEVDIHTANCALTTADASIADLERRIIAIRNVIPGSYLRASRC